jgi:hypothetical protein
MATRTNAGAPAAECGVSHQETAMDLVRRTQHRIACVFSVVVLALGAPPLCAERTAATTSDAGDLESAFIGTVYSRLPTRYSRSWLVDQDDVDLQYSIDLVGFNKDDMIWLAVTSTHSEHEEPLWRVVDVLRLPRDYESQGLEVVNCRSPHTRDRAVVGLVRTDTREPVRVWDVDFRARRFVEMQVLDGHCITRRIGD